MQASPRWQRQAGSNGLPCFQVSFRFHFTFISLWQVSLGRVQSWHCQLWSLTLCHLLVLSLTLRPHHCDGDWHSDTVPVTLKLMVVHPETHPENRVHWQAHTSIDTLGAFSKVHLQTLPPLSAPPPRPRQTPRPSHSALTLPPHCLHAFAVPVLESVDILITIRYSVQGLRCRALQACYYDQLCVDIQYTVGQHIYVGKRWPAVLALLHLSALLGTLLSLLQRLLECPCA